MILLPSRDPTLRIEHTRSLLALFPAGLDCYLDWLCSGWFRERQKGLLPTVLPGCGEQAALLEHPPALQVQPWRPVPRLSALVLGPVFQSRAHGRRGHGPHWGDGESAGIPASAWVEGRPEAPKVPAGHLEWTGLLSSSLGFSPGFPHSLQSLFFFLSFHFFLFLP